MVSIFRRGVMDPFTMSALIGAGGGLLEGGFNFLGQSSANRANQRMANQQMAFQERMSSTAYQRAMQDMRLAGLNPILAGKLGGASAPPGAQATAQNELSGLQGTTAKALQARKDAAEIRNLLAQNDQIVSQTGLNSANRVKALQEAKLLGAKGATESFVASQADRAGKAVDQLTSSAGGYARSIGSWLADLFNSPRDFTNPRKR